MNKVFNGELGGTRSKTHRSMEWENNDMKTMDRTQEYGTTSTEVVQRPKSNWTTGLNWYQLVQSRDKMMNMRETYIDKIEHC